MVQEMKKLVHKILETPFWPEDLQAMKRYFRTHDDCDGELGNGIVVTISTDGDVWVDTCPGGCRFRMPMTGGGLSPRVRNALLLLAVAIKLDNQEHAIPSAPALPPQRSGGRQKQVVGASESAFNSGDLMNAMCGGNRIPQRGKL